MRKRLFSLMLAFIMVFSLLPAFSTPAFAASDTDISDMDALTALGIDTSVAPDGFDATSTNNPYGTDVVSMGTVSELYTVGLTAKTAYTNPTVKAATQAPLTDESYKNSNSNALEAQLYGHNDWISENAWGVFDSGPKVTEIATGTTDQTANYTYVGTGTYLTGATNTTTSLGSGSSAFNYALSSVAAGSFDGNKSSLSAQVAMVYTTNYSANGGLYLRIGDANGTYGSTAIELLSTSNKIGNPDLKDTEGNLVENFAENPYQLQNYLQVATGDWDGDGLDEIAVYVPEYGKSRILIYDLQNASAYQSADRWKLAWSYYLQEGTVVSNMVSFVSGDVNKDGIPDLAATWGYYYGPSQNKGSTAVVMFGAKGTNMFKASQQFGLNYGSSNIVRAAFAYGDLAGSGTPNLILCGQSDADLQDNNLYTRYVALYAWDGSSFTSTVNKNFDLFEKDKDGNYTYGSMVTGRSKTDDKYTFYSLPLCVSNVAVVSNGITAKTSNLYFDSLIINYGENGLGIQEAWDNTPAMQDSTTNLKEYVEYSAVSGALTGKTGAGMVATMTQTLSSSATTTGHYTVTGSHQEPTWGQNWYYKNWWYKLWKIKTYYWYITGYRTVADATSVAYNVDKLTMGAAVMVFVDPETNKVSRTAADFSLSLCLVNTDQDSSYMKYGNKHYFTYTDPQVLAVIASPPYFADLLNRDDLSGNYGESTTSYSSTKGSSGGVTASASIKAGVYVSVEQEFSVFGVKVAQAEAEASITASFTYEFEYSSSLEQTVTYNAASGEDMIAFYSIPMEIFEYTSYVADGSGSYKEVLTTINVPHEAAVKLISLKDYEAIAADYAALPRISGTILTHEVGDPSTYPRSTDGYSVIAQYSGTPSAVGYSSTSGGASITQEIAMSKTTSNSFSGSVETEFKAGAGAGGVTVGVIVGGAVGCGKVTTTTNGSSFSGDMQNMPIEAAPFGYAMNWKIFCYEYEKGNLNFPIVNYLITEYTMPPTLPKDFEQDVASSTSNSVTLRWSYDKLVSSFDIYRYYEFPDGSGSYKVVSVPMTAADSYDAATGMYYFSYTDGNLSPYTDYQYQIQTIGMGTQNNKSIYSEPLTVRTKTDTGYPDITLGGLSNGSLLLYPDASSTVTAVVADPVNGEYKGLNYQWQKLVDGAWTDLRGADKPSYTFSNSGATDALTYRCRINAIFFSNQSLTEYQISAYSASFATAYSRRTPQATLTAPVSGTTLTPAIKLWSANAGHTAAPSGTVTFTVKAMDYEYSKTVDLQKSSATEVIDGTAKYYSTASFGLSGLKDGVYTVTAYYSGSRVFKSLDIDKGELAIIGSGSAYRIDLSAASGGDSVTGFTYGDAVYPHVSYISKNAGGEASSTDYTGNCTIEYSANGSTYTAFTPGSRTLNAGSYTMRATYGGEEVATQAFTVSPKAITVTIPNLTNISAGADVLSHQPVPTLAAGSSMAGGETALSDLNLTYTAYNSAGTPTPLDQDATPGNYAVIACKSSSTDNVKYANYSITYLPGTYTIIGVTYKLTISAANYTDSNGTRSVGTARIKDGGLTGYYSNATNVTLLAAPNPGFEVSRWEAVFADSSKTTQNGGNTMYLDTKAQTVDVTVYFKASVYTLSTASAPSAGGTITCDAGSFSSGAFVSTGAQFNFTAAPAAGYTFGHWELSTGGSPVSYSGTPGANGTNSYTVTVGTSSATLYAVFVRDSYRLTLNGNIAAFYWRDDDGLASTPPVKTAIASGTSVQGDTAVTVCPKTGYSAAVGASYSVNAASATPEADGSCTFNITGVTTVSLETVRGSFAVSASAQNALGTVSIAVDNAAKEGTKLSNVPGGSKVAFTAKAIRGYVFDYWAIDGSEEHKDGVTNADNSNTLTIAELGADTAVTAVFKTNPAYTFTASVSNSARGGLIYTLTDIYGGAVAANEEYGNGNALTVYKGESLTLTAAPVGGSMVEQWVINGSATSTYDASKTFGNIGQSYTAVVYLKSSTGYQVSYASGDHGSVSATADGANFASGAVLSGGSKAVFTATPDSGFMVEKWTAVSGLNSTTEVTIKDADNVNLVDPVYTINNLNGHYAVKPYFTAAVTKNVSTADITGGGTVITYMTPVTAGSGALSNVTSCDVRAGGTVKLTFTAASGWATDSAFLKTALSGFGQVVNVTQVVWGKSYTAEIKNVTDNIAVKNCSPFYPLYTVSVSDPANGVAAITDVTPSQVTDYYLNNGSSALVTSGSAVVVTLTPATGYEVGALTVGGSAVAPQYVSESASDVMAYTTSGITADTAVNAAFMAIEPSVTVSYKPLDKTGQNEGTGNGIVSAAVSRKSLDAYAEVGTPNSSMAAYESVTCFRDGIVTLTATPDSGYKFVSWTIDGIAYNPANSPAGISVAGNTMTISVGVDSASLYKAEALFEYIGDAITYAAVGNGTISAHSSATGASFASGTKLAWSSVLTFTALPETGYIVEGWYLNNEKQAGETGSTFSYDYDADDNIGADITVKFIRESYCVTYSSQHGSISGIDLSPALIQGDTVLSLTATPDTGYSFAYWKVDGEDAGTDNPLSLTVSKNFAVEAVFETVAGTCTVLFSAGSGGSLGALNGTSAIQSGAAIVAGSGVTFTAVPDAGKQVKGWTVNGTPVPSSSEQLVYSVASILESIEVEVEFESVSTYDLTLSLGTHPHGTVTATVNGTATAINGNVLTVTRHANVVLTASPSAHYAFIGWGGDGGGTAATLTLADVTADKAITASFVAAEYVKFTAFDGANGKLTVKAVSDGEESILRLGTQVEIVAGSTVTLTAEPDSGFMVQSWTKGGTVLSNRLSKTLTLEALTSDTTVSVAFEAYKGYAIPTGTDTYTITGMTRTPDDTTPTGEIRDRGTLSFLVTIGTNHYLTGLQIFGINCLVSTETTTTVPGSDTDVKSVPNSDGTYTITLSNVTGPITIAATEHKLDIQTFSGDTSVKTAMLTAVSSMVSGATEPTTSFYDIALKAKDASGNWVDATDALPAEGVSVLLPYPAGVTFATASNYNFSVAHMITTGTRAGSIEYLTPAPTADGLRVTVYSLSPFAVGFASKPTDTAGDIGGGAGGGTLRSHAVTVSAANHGTIQADKSSAAAGTTITLTIRADAGYGLTSIAVTDATGATIETTKNSSGTYSFQMPGSGVTVKAVFSFSCRGGDDCPAHAFTDVDIDAWYHEGIDFVLSKGLFNGVTDTTFAPNTAMTRAMLVTVLYRLEGKPAVSGTVAFTDLSADGYYSSAVIWASQNGIVAGYSDGRFAPNDTITREQLATILYRYAGYKEYTVAQGAELSGYADASGISGYAVDALRWANAAGLITGTTTTSLSPQGEASRAQVATILMRFSGSFA